MDTYFLTIWRHHEDRRGPICDREGHLTLESALSKAGKYFIQKNKYVPLPYSAGVTGGMIYEMMLNPPAETQSSKWWNMHVEAIDGAHSVIIESRDRCIGAIHEENMEGNKPAIPDSLKW